MHFVGTPCLKEEIELKRQQMLELAKSYGFLHPNVIKISQDLDLLINRMQNNIKRED
ncbi:aspartyl-phosphate phosphatase Spo0E family protein [Cytobacillus sp. FJAT-54145]|uniref:Aspartyl-phosphate phosphatase Spo0E family protein n=1 Tax=Cytobacillus spartinae TaxID=3299023 RepID=A0ABW6KJM9_9BACI